MTSPISNPDPAAEAAGVKAANTPAPIIEPNPITTASKVPSRRPRPCGLLMGLGLPRDCQDDKDAIESHDQCSAGPPGNPQWRGIRADAHDLALAGEPDQRNQGE